MVSYTLKPIGFAWQNCPLCAPLSETHIENYTLLRAAILKSHSVSDAGKLEQSISPAILWAGFMSLNVSKTSKLRPYESIICALAMSGDAAVARAWSMPPVALLTSW